MGLPFTSGSQILSGIALSKLFAEAPTDATTTGVEFIDRMTSMRVYQAFALACREAEDVQVLVMGHASPDGLAQDNVRLAKERARQVATHLEFAGVPPQRIRVEGHGSDRPMVRCPEGVDCPESLAERSRRTELYLISAQRP